MIRRGGQVTRVSLIPPGKPSGQKVPLASVEDMVRLNIASIAGLPIAMTAFLWGNLLLPHPRRRAWLEPWPVMFSGHTSIVAGLVYGLLLGYARMHPRTLRRR